MYFLRLVLKNIFRHTLRSALTLSGLVVAILAFGLLQTVVNAWYAGSEMASAQRLITRNAISLVFPIPVWYRDRIRAIDGVTGIATSNWFGGLYKDQTPANFFPQFAVDPEHFFDLYPEFLVKPEELVAFKKDRRGALVGRLLADQHGFKVGDVIPVKGTIYPGNWEFVVRGIYEPSGEGVITRQLYFHWDYLNEQTKKLYPRRADQVGVPVRFARTLVYPEPVTAANAGFLAGLVRSGPAKWPGASAVEMEDGTKVDLAFRDAQRHAAHRMGAAVADIELLDVKQHPRAPPPRRRDRPRAPAHRAAHPPSCPRRSCGRNSARRRDRTPR